MHFMKGVFVPRKISLPYNSKITSGRNLKFLPVGFGYKIPLTSIFIKISDVVIKKIFLVICHGMTQL